MSFRVIHFTLFVRACVETHQRNNLNGPAVMYVQQPMYYQPQPGYPQAVPAGTVAYAGMQQPQQAHYSMYGAPPQMQQQMQQPMQQQTVPGQHLQPKELQPNMTGSSNDNTNGRMSYPSAPSPVYDQTNPTYAHQ